MCVLMEFYRELCSDNKTADKTRQSHKYVISSSRSNCQRVGERQQVRTEFFFFFLAVDNCFGPTWQSNFS